MQEPPLSYKAFRTALETNLGSLVQLSDAHPVKTLTFLDGMMRGLLDGPYTDEQITWLVDADRTVRRFLGRRQQDADLAILRAAYRHSALYLILGAGISQGAGMPGWKDLVIQVLECALSGGDCLARYQKGSADGHRLTLSDVARSAVQSVVERLKRADVYTSADLISASQAATAALRDRFPDVLRAVLYGRPLTNSAALDVLTRLVRPRLAWGQTPRLSAIITFNYDDLVETTLARAAIASTAHASVRGEWRTMRGWITGKDSAIDVYHVHGYAPDAPADLTHVDFVFTEEQYARTYSREQGLARAVQQSFLSRSVGLVLGSSLSDDYALSELRRAREMNPGWRNYVMMHDSDPRSKEDHAALGLRVLWYHNRDEIPSLLQQIEEEEDSEPSR
jgi:hypothetical protein